MNAADADRRPGTRVLKSGLCVRPITRDARPGFLATRPPARTFLRPQGSFGAPEPRYQSGRRLLTGSV